MAAWKLFNVLAVGLCTIRAVPALSEELLHFESNPTNRNAFTVNGEIIVGGIETGPLQLEGTVIEGVLDFPASLLERSLLEHTNAPARGHVLVPIRSLRSKAVSGGPHGPEMEQRTAKVLLADQQPNMLFLLRAIGRDPDAAPSSVAGYRAYGEIVIAGATNSTEIPFVAERKPQALLVKGKGAIRWSAFKIDNPVPSVAEFRLRDEMRFSFEWSLTQTAK